MLNSLKKVLSAKSENRKPNTRSVRLQVESLDDRIVPAGGTWTQIANQPNGGSPGTMMLLPDGTVMGQGNGVSNLWYKYSPNATTGSYTVGAGWSPLASMVTPRLYTGSNVLPDGKVFVLGGEYTNAGNIWTNTGEIYNSLTNTWSSVDNFPQSQFGDDPTMVLDNGKILAGYLSGPQTYLFNPSAAPGTQWTATGTKLRNDRSDEETFVLLPDHSVLTYELFSNVTNFTHAQRYNPTTGLWSDAGTLPAGLTLSSSALGFEVGPALLLPDGRVFQIGANNHTALYTPSTNSWAAGPDMTPGFGSADGPGAILPNGHVIFTANNSGVSTFNAPTKMFEFDPVANTITDITATLPAPLITNLNGSNGFEGRMLMLPTGQLMFSTGVGLTYIYTMSAAEGGPALNQRPVVQNVTATGGGNYHMTGLRLNGISAGASYGDDAEMDENYPIVSIKNLTTGVVTYARTSNWAPGVVGSPGDAVTLGADFKLPSGTAAGTYTLTVSAAGISSVPILFRVTAAVPASFSQAAASSEASSSSDVNLAPTLGTTGNGGTNQAGETKVKGGKAKGNAVATPAPAPVASPATINLISPLKHADKIDFVSIDPFTQF